jgi:hypothetical protein
VSAASIIARPAAEACGPGATFVSGSDQLGAHVAPRMLAVVDEEG